MINAILESPFIQNNLEFVKGISDSLHHSLILNLENCLLSPDGANLTIKDGTSSYNVQDPEQFLASLLETQNKKPTRIRYARISNPSPDNVSQALARVVAGEHFAAARLITGNSADINCLPTRDHILVGSLLLPAYLSELTKEDLPTSVTICESSPAALLYSLSQFDLQTIIKSFKENGISFSLVFDEKDIVTSFYKAFLGTKLPAIHGLKIINSPYLSPLLLDLQSYLTAASGLSHESASLIGDTADEMSQFANAVKNVSDLMHRPSAFHNLSDLIDGEHSSLDVVVFGSGPSLDEFLSCYSIPYSEKLLAAILIAAGSSVGALVASNIYPTYLVLLERDLSLFDELSALVKSYPALSSETTLIMPYSSDPRLKQLFERCVFCARPLSSATPLVLKNQRDLLFQNGPETVNAALDIAIKLNPRRLFLVGCDHSSPQRSKTRSAAALGHTPRILDIPENGFNSSIVYTSPDLLLAAKCASNSIAFLNDTVSVFQVGNGIPMTRASFIPVSTFWTAFCEDAALAIHKSTVDLTSPDSPFSVIDLRELLQSAKLCAVEDLTTLKSSVLSHSSWDSVLLTTLNNYTSFCESAEPPMTIAIRRIFRSYVFYSSAILYDSTGGNDSFAASKLLFIEQLDKLEQLFIQFIDYLSGSL